jgi:hypothetical protein
MSPELEDVRRLTQYYRYLQGLKLLPMGLAMMAFGGVLLAFPALVEDRRTALISLGLFSVVAVAGYLGFLAYYHRAYGQVREAPTMRRRSNRFIGASAVLGLILGGLLALPPVARSVWGPVTFGVLYAGLLLYYWDWSGRFLPHYPVISAALAIGSLVGLPVVAAFCAPGTARTTVGGLLFVLYGVATTAVGVLDHRWMVRRLVPATGEERDVGTV